MLGWGVTGFILTDIKLFVISQAWQTEAQFTWKQCSERQFLNILLVLSFQSPREGAETCCNGEKLKSACIQFQRNDNGLGKITRDGSRCDLQAGQPSIEGCSLIGLCLVLLQSPVPE